MRCRWTWITWCRISWDMRQSSADARVAPHGDVRGLARRMRRQLCHCSSRPYGLACHPPLRPPFRTENRSPAKTRPKRLEALFLYGVQSFIRKTSIKIGFKEETGWSTRRGEPPGWQAGEHGLATRLVVPLVPWGERSPVLLRRTNGIAPCLDSSVGSRVGT